MTNRTPAWLTRSLVAGAGLLALACLGTCVVPLILQNTIWATEDPLSLATLHRSTFSRVENNAEATAVLFADGGRALVADDLWENRRLYLADLAAGSRAELELPRGERLNLYALLNGGDVAYALYRAEDERLLAFRVSAGGALAELRVLDYTTLVVGEEPPEAAALEAALAGGELTGLRGMEKERCAWDAAAGRYVSLRVEGLRHFANDRYLVISNVDTMSARLEQLSGPPLRDSCAGRLPPEHGRYRVELTRSDAGAGGGRSALDTRLATATLFRDGEAVHTFTFTEPDAWYYYAAWAGGRLYFVGTSVRYLDLGRLP